MQPISIILSKKELLTDLNFIYLSGGKVQLGTDNPLICRLEGYRKNETPVRFFQVKPFWICRFCVTNSEFEQFNPKHFRPPTSLGDNNPVTDITYMDALTYLKWLSEKLNLDLRLPTELEWTFAAAPFGWEFPYKKEAQPDKDKAHTFDLNNYQTIAVNDQRFTANCFGLSQVGGNVFEMTNGWYYAPGHFGSLTDGAYYIAKGGDFGHCAFSAGIQRRAIFDVTDRSSRVGFRLAHSAL